MGINFREVDSNNNGYVDYGGICKFFLKTVRQEIERGNLKISDSLINDVAKFRAEAFWQKEFNGKNGLNGHHLDKNISLKDIVQNPQKYPDIEVDEGDKELVRNGSWDAFDTADADHNGRITQSGIFGGTNELETHVTNFVGASSSDAIFPVDKQKEYKERFGLWRKNVAQDGNWQPTENLTIKDFANLWFQNEDSKGVQSIWSFRRFYGYP